MINQAVSRDEEEFNLKLAYNSELPITKVKKQDLLLLCTNRVIPDVYHNFYKSLPCEQDNTGVSEQVSEQQINSSSTIANLKANCRDNQPVQTLQLPLRLVERIQFKAGPFIITYLSLHLSLSVDNTSFMKMVACLWKI